MKPPDALTLPVAVDMAAASMEDAWLLIGSPDYFRIHVHPRANHLAHYLAYEVTQKNNYTVVDEPEYEEFEWMVDDLNGKRCWVPGP